MLLRFIARLAVSIVIAITFDHAKALVAYQTLDEALLSADLVVIGRVTHRFRVANVQVAELVVSQRLKGDSPDTVVYLAQAMGCNVSGATVGKLVLIMLQSYQFDPDPELVLMSYGRYRTRASLKSDSDSTHGHGTELVTSYFQEPYGFQVAYQTLRPPRSLYRIVNSGWYSLPITEGTSEDSVAFSPPTRIQKLLEHRIGPDSIYAKAPLVDLVTLIEEKLKAAAIDSTQGGR